MLKVGGLPGGGDAQAERWRLSAVRSREEKGGFRPARGPGGCSEYRWAGKRPSAMAVSMEGASSRHHQLGAGLEGERMEDERREGGDQQGGLHGAGQAGPGHGRAVGECPLSGVWTSGGECPLWGEDVQGAVSVISLRCVVRP